MAEVTVKLLADVSSLVRDAEKAVHDVADKPASIHIEADTQPLLEGVKKALNEIEKLQPVIRLNPQNAQNDGFSAAREWKNTASGTRSQETDKHLLEMIKASQQLDTKNNEALKSSIDELKHVIERLSKNSSRPVGQNNDRKTSPIDLLTQGLFQRNDTPEGDNSGSGGNSESMLKNLMSSFMGGGGGIMGALKAIPGVGQIMGMLSVAGLAQKASEMMEKDAQANASAREQAAGALANTYDVFGSVGAYAPEQYGEEGYSTGTYISMKTGQEYGYDLSETLSASDSLMAKSGFTDTQRFQNDITSVLAASRATGVDTSNISALAGTATQYGYQQSGDQGKILALLGRSVETTGMRGREDEMVDVLQSILEELGSVNAAVSEEAVNSQLDLLARISAVDPNMTGERAKSAMDSIESWATSSDQSVLIAAGLGTKYTGIEGYNALRRMQEENPEAFTEEVINNMLNMGMSNEDILFKLGQSDIGSYSQNEVMLEAIRNGDEYVSADMTDQEANRAEGEAYIGRNNAQYTHTVAPYAWNQIAEDIGSTVNGMQEASKYKGFYEKSIDRTAQEDQSEDFHKRNNIFGQRGYDAFKYEILAGGKDQMESMETSWKQAQSGALPSNTSTQNIYSGRRVSSQADTYAGNAAIPATQSENYTVTVSSARQAAYTSAPTVTVSSAPTASQSVENTESAIVPDLEQGTPAEYTSAPTVTVSSAPSLSQSSDSETNVLNKQVAVPFTEDFGANVQNNIEYASERLQDTETQAALGTAAIFANPITGLGALGFAMSANEKPSSTYGIDSSISDTQLDESISGQAFETDSDRSFLDALARNTSALEENTKTMEGESGISDNSDTYTFASQGQGSLNGGMENPLSERSRSIGSMMALSGQTTPFAQFTQSMAQGNVVGAVSSISSAVANIAGMNTSGDGTGAYAYDGNGNSTSSAAQTTTTKEDDGSVTVSGGIIPAAVGIDNVPYDGYKTSLHKGEMVLTRDESERVRRGTSPLSELVSMGHDLTSQAQDLNSGTGDTNISDLVAQAEAMSDFSHKYLLNDTAPETPADITATSNERQKVDAILSQTEDKSSTIAFQGGDLNINISVTGHIEGMNEDMQMQIVQAVRSQISDGAFRDRLANGYTRRQNY